MNKGRITKEEQEYRISMLLRFIFIFRYATREQLFEFAQDRLKLSYPRWLIDYATKQGFITTYHEPILRLKVYYLTQRGQGFLHRYEPFSSHYRFNNRHTGFNTFEHQQAVIESYFILYKELAIKEWVPEWVVNKKFKIKVKIPDALIVLNPGTKIALEVETWYKQRGEWKNVVYNYNREMPRYDIVLIVAYSSSNYEGIKDRLFYTKPEFSERAFMLADLILLNRGECFYQGQVRQIKEAIELLKSTKVT
ncbi:hypothetical protein D4Q80_02345 [bacterium]|nr:MAG: hypothetical protein D4Q80_02345 [bacterium]